MEQTAEDAEVSKTTLEEQSSKVVSDETKNFYHDYVRTLDATIAMPMLNSLVVNLDSIGIT